jgi:tRNA(Glu) U13 pseudouridine synthase TruD
MASKVAYSQRRLGDEMDLLRGHLREGSFKAAFEALTFQKRSMWVAAYVSALWNRLASLRLEAEPRCAMAGDCLLTDEDAEREAEASDAHGDGSPGADLGESQRGRCRVSKIRATPGAVAGSPGPGADMGSEARLESCGGPQLCTHGGKKAVLIALGGETLTRVGLPIPSRTATYAHPVLQSAFEAQLTADGVDLSSLPSKVAVRRIVALATDVSIEVIADPQPIGARANGLNGLDVRLDFRLQSSTYATMALRQILRCASTELEERREERDLRL